MLVTLNTTGHSWRVRSSSQDRGVGRNASLPLTTKRKITTNVKAKNNQNCQKIKLHGSPTTKELKKYSSRLVGGAETMAERTHKARWWTLWAIPHSHVNKPRRIAGEQDRPCNPGFQPRKLKTQNPWMQKSVGVVAPGEIPTSQESSLERPTGC